MQLGNFDYYFVYKFKIHLFKWYFCCDLMESIKKIEQYHKQRLVLFTCYQNLFRSSESIRKKNNNLFIIYYFNESSTYFILVYVLHII